MQRSTDQETWIYLASYDAHTNIHTYIYINDRIMEIKKMKTYSPDVGGNKNDERERTKPGVTDGE